MTTEAAQDPQPATPQGMDASDVREVYRSLGNLERGQAEIKERFDRQEERNDQRFARIEERADRREERSEERADRREERSEERATRQEERSEQRATRQEERGEQRFHEVTRRIDRLWYTIVGVGAALAVGYILDRVLSGG